MFSQNMQQYGSMVETGTNKIKEKDDDFMKNVSVIKSITAVYSKFDLPV